MKTYGEWSYSPTILTLAVYVGEWLASRPGRLNPKERALGILFIGYWVGPRVGLDAVEKRKSLAPAGDLTPAVHPVARYNTD
jgi:hypothetical protein